MDGKTRYVPDQLEQSIRGRDITRFIPVWVAARTNGPGALYNMGNFIALFSGVGLVLWDLRGQGGAFDGLQDHLVGSAPAAWLTSAIIVFCVSGEIYHRAFHGAPERRVILTLWADLISGLAAVALTIALIGFGDTTMAIVAGVMLAGGKLGNALLPLVPLRRPGPLEFSLRFTVLASRFPSILALALSLRLVFEASGPIRDMVMPAIMIGCFLLWLAADAILLRRSVSDEVGRRGRG